MRRPSSIQDVRFIAGRRVHRAWSELLRRVGGEASAQRRRRRWFIADLQRLNDVLAGTAVADVYWVWGGLLLGWAREGSVLEHDDGDADFGILTSDRFCFEKAVPALVAAGFAPLHRFVTNAGTVVEYSFLRHGAKFDFFLLERHAHELRYHLFSTATFDRPAIQAVAVIGDQPTTTFTFLDRTWRKHADHDAELTAIYGDWRTPDPDWHYGDAEDIIERQVWLAGRAGPWIGESGDPAIRTSP